jgi:DNA-binding NarL/FixJ family response regulator
MDLQMPQVNGIEATRRILQENPNARVLVVTLFEEDCSVFMTLKARARGYVLKAPTRRRWCSRSR